MIPRTFLIAVGIMFSVSCHALTTHCEGKGPLLYLVVGGPAFSSWHIEPVQKHLANRYRVCRWDMRGVGDNASPDFEPDKRALLQWLDDMREVLPDEPVILWGHSWGALQVLLFARAYPSRVRHLVLNNPVDPALHSLQHIEQKLYVHPDIDAKLSLDDIGTEKESRFLFRSKIAGYFMNAQQGWNYSAQFSQADTNNALNVAVWNDYRQMPLSDWDVHKLRAKVSGIISCRADVLQPESLNEYRRLLPDTNHYVLEDCAHFPWEENPAAYFRALDKLLDK